MKRRVRRLEVTTFPFLAVLLCTMGSLILLLFVFDRRAKAVAHHKAQEDAAARTALLALEYKGLDEQKSDWERRHQELHTALLKEQEELRAQLMQGDTKAAEAQFKLQAEEKQATQLAKELRQAEEQLAAAWHALQNQQHAAAGKSDQADSARTKLERQKQELQRLEQALADLKAIRLRQQNAYSIVPYHGTRGDKRKPIYVELSSEGVVFHPDRLSLMGLSLTSAGLRAEVEKRIMQTSSQASDSSERPYLLMLVRPNGITNYYKAQEALAGLKLDFGYEFIEQDWALDFNASAKGDVAQTDHEPSHGVATPKPTSPQPYASAAGTGSLGTPQLKLGGAIVGMPPPAFPLANAGTSWLPMPPTSIGPTSPSGTPAIVSAPVAAMAADTKDVANVIKEPGNSKTDKISGQVDKGASGKVMSQGQAPPSLGRILGNRDLIIDIECRGDGVLVKHRSQKFLQNVLSAPTKGEHPLAKAVRDIITRRQATLAPGEPPYRPMVRFLVRPEGLAAYYLAYPLLEGVGAPMQRENVDKDS